MSVKRCQQEIDSREFVEWQAYFGLDPFGEDRADLRAGIIAMTIANSQRAKGTRPFTAQEFMPTFGRRRPREEQTPQQMLAVFRQIAAATA